MDANTAAEIIYACEVAEAGDDEREMCAWCSESAVVKENHCEREPCIAISARERHLTKHDEDDRISYGIGKEALSAIVREHNEHPQGLCGTLETVMQETGRDLWFIGTLPSGRRITVSVDPADALDLMAQMQDILEGGANA